MHLPHVRPERRAVVDKVIVLLCMICNGVEFVCYLLIFRLQYVNNRRTAREKSFSNTLRGSWTLRAQCMKWGITSSCKSPLP